VQGGGGGELLLGSVGEVRWSGGSCCWRRGLLLFGLGSLVVVVVWLGSLEEVVVDGSAVRVKKGGGRNCGRWSELRVVGGVRWNSVRMSL
jgi:hypothetical protein